MENIDFNITEEDKKKILANQRKEVKESKKEYEEKWDGLDEKNALKNYAENEVNLLKLELGIDLPEEFKSLDDAGQLMVLRDLKNRVVDIVKSDAQNKYSEYLKEENLTKIEKFSRRFDDKFLKGIQIQQNENWAFEEIKNSEEGKKLIQENLELLTKITKDKKLEVDSKGNVVIKFIETNEFFDEEWDKAYDFNNSANKFRNMPYEWGQTEKKNKVLSFFSKESRNKQAYDKAKKQYDAAREEILNIKSKSGNKEEQEKALIEMLEIDNAIKMDQVLNTHPEFQVALEQMTEGANVRRWMKDSISKSFQGIGLSNKAITALGFTARMTAKGAATLGAATGITAIAAPIIGASIGALRGNIKAKETLKQNKKQSRYGKEDESKEKVNMTDIDHLSRQLNNLISKVNSSTDEKEKAENLAMLDVRIQHTKGKMEKGEVNFGDAKSALVKQYNILNSLNEAVLLTGSNNGDINKEVENRINYLVQNRSTKTNEEINEKQEKFIKKQMKKSALMGAGFATVGYIARWAGEELGWWGHTENTVVDAKTDEIPEGLKVEAPDGTEESFTTTDHKIAHFVAKDGKWFYKKPDGMLENTPYTNENGVKYLNKEWDDQNSYMNRAEKWVEEKWDKITGGNDVKDTAVHAKTELPKVKVPPLSKHEVIEKIKETATKVGNKIEKFEAKADSVIKEKLHAVNDTAHTTEAPAETIKKVTKKAAEKIAELKSELADKYPRGAQMDFAVTLGKNGVPKNLETAFSEIAADHMSMPVDGIVDEEFATKSLNISANLVELTKGHHVAHIDTEEFKNAFNFNEKTGEFEIKDHEKFNGILENLEKHADEQWENGTLRTKGGAISYISKIKGDSWLKIVHADGMHENIDGDATGIEGHQDVTIDKIKNFTDSEIVKKASVHIETGTELEHGHKVSAEDLMSDAEKAARHSATEQEMIRAEAGTGHKVTEEDLMSASEKAKHGINAKDLDHTHDVADSIKQRTIDEQTINNQPPENMNEHDLEEYNNRAGNTLNEVRRGNEIVGDNYTLSQQEWYKVGDVNGKNLNKIFNFDLNKYKVIKDNTADDMLSKNINMEGMHPIYKKFLVYIHELQEKTHLEPRHAVLIPPTAPETIDEYITRALGKAQAMKILNKVEL